MAKRIHFKELCQRVSVPMLLEHYGLLTAAKCRNGEYTLRCVFHDDSQASLNINESGLFQCFGCKASGGDVIDFVAQKEAVSLRQAALLIDSWFSHEAQNEAISVVEEEIAAPELPHIAEARNEPLEFGLSVDSDHPYLYERGLYPGTVKEFGVGLCTSERSIMAGRIIIPITHWNPLTYDAYLVAYAGRFPGNPPDTDTPKYLFPPYFHKSAVVYNLISAGRYAREQGLILMEGFFSVMRLWQMGIRTGVSIMGSSLSAVQEELIVNTVGIGSGKVTLMFDPDDAGHHCRDDVLARLCQRVHVRVVNLETSPDELSDRSLRSALHL